MTTNKSIANTVAENVKPPISFKEFSKNPVVGTMFIVLIAIGYLYIDIRGVFEEQSVKQEKRIEKLETKVDVLTNLLRVTDSALSSANTKIITLEMLGSIQ
jgi:hypothetical protein